MPLRFNMIWNVEFKYSVPLSLWTILGVPSINIFSKAFATCITRISADADKPARYIYRSVKVTKHVTIRYVRYGFLLVCYSNFVRKIFDFKNAVTLKTGSEVRQGHWNVTVWQNACDFLLTFCSNMALSRVICEIQCRKYCDPEILVKGQSRSLKMGPFNRLV